MTMVAFSLVLAIYGGLAYLLFNPELIGEFGARIINGIKYVSR